VNSFSHAAPKAAVPERPEAAAAPPQCGLLQKRFLILQSATLLMSSFDPIARLAINCHVTSIKRVINHLTLYFSRPRSGRLTHFKKWVEGFRQIESQRPPKRWLLLTLTRNARKKQTRLWAILTETKDLAMLDAESIIDGDGDEVYRVIHSVGHDGMPSQDGWGGIRYFTTMFIHARFVSPVSDELQKKLDTWIATRREDANGFRSRVMEIEPCEVKVPGWERVSAKVLEKRKKKQHCKFCQFYDE
jgi:hypothetical protein